MNLKRYDNDLCPDPEGRWVEYNDIWPLDNNNFALGNHVKILEDKVKELEDLFESELKAHQRIEADLRSAMISLEQDKNRYFRLWREAS